MGLGSIRVGGVWVDKWVWTYFVTSTLYVWREILGYFQSTENCAFFFYIHGAWGLLIKFIVGFDMNVRKRNTIYLYFKNIWEISIYDTLLLQLNPPAHFHTSWPDFHSLLLSSILIQWGEIIFYHPPELCSKLYFAP